MKLCALLLLLCSVTLISALTTNRIRRNEKSDDSVSLQQKRQIGVEKQLGTNKRIKKSLPECHRNNDKMPDYKKPGRRISEVKCMELTWDITNRDTCNTEKKGFAAGVSVGGFKTGPGEFPHMGAVGWKTKDGSWVFKCGATLISAKLALTAAHCSLDRANDDISPTPEIVRLGDNIIDQGINVRPPVDAVISRIIKHPEYGWEYPTPEYKAPKKYNDIALLEFEKPVEFSFFVHPACLWGSADLTTLGTKATMTGWGVVDTVNRTSYSPGLRKVVLDIIDSERCEVLLKPYCTRLWCGVKDSQLCSRVKKGEKDSCQGDSGGPLQVEIKLPEDIVGKLHYVIGVTSFGINCGLTNVPGVYTRVSSYIDWIEQTIWGL